MSDHINIGSQSTITRHFIPDQTILLSCQMRRYTIRDKRKERILLLTSKHIYSLRYQKTIESKVSYKDILSISANKSNPSALVIHVAKQNDYHINTQMKKQVIQELSQRYFDCHNEKLPFYLYDDDQLFKKTIKRFINKNRKIHTIQPTDIVEENRITSDIKEQYEFLNVIGVGATSKVLLATNKSNGKQYAVKVTNKQVIIERQAITRIKTERQILQKVKSPFLVSLYSASQSKDQVFLVIDFMQGGDLYTYLSQVKKLPQAQVKFYLAQIYLALNAIHRQGFLYRDLKLQNVLFDKDGYIKLADFDLSKRLQHGQLTYSIVGTPQYVSPQLIKGSGASYASDWWAFGVIVYELIYGRTPFYHANHETMFNNVLHHQVKFDPQKANPSAQCQNFIEGLLNKQPEKRIGFQDEQQIKNHAWFADMKWDQIVGKTIVPEFIPKITSSTDVSHFSDDFTQQPLFPAENNDLMLISRFQKEFEGFQYSASQQIGEKKGSKEEEAKEQDFKKSQQQQQRSQSIKSQSAKSFRAIRKESANSQSAKSEQAKSKSARRKSQSAKSVQAKSASAKSELANKSASVKSGSAKSESPKAEQVKQEINEQSKQEEKGQQSPMGQQQQKASTEEHKVQLQGSNTVNNIQESKQQGQ